MEKKKTRKTETKENFEYSVELTGLILILIGLIGFGFGPVGSYIKKFTMFLVGGWAWIFLLIFILSLGGYMLFKRKLPKFMSQRLIGLYVIIIEYQQLVVILLYLLVEMLQLKLVVVLLELYLLLLLVPYLELQGLKL